MKTRGPLLVLLFAGVALVGGLTSVFRLRVAQGDVFPPYSSLRADPLGIRALHDGLARIAGMQVERHLKPVAAHPVEPARTLVFAGVSKRSWSRVRREDFDAVNLAVRAGSRLVVTLRAQGDEDLQEALREEAVLEDDEAADEPDGAKQDEGKRALVKRKIEYVDLQRHWGLAVKTRVKWQTNGIAERAVEGSPAGLPQQITWRSDIHFAPEPSAEWTVIYRRDEQPVMIERRLGRGTIVVLADSYLLSNEALQRERASELLAWMVGPHRRVVFDEAHLGVMTQPGVAALARRYGLSGAFFTLLLLAGLFVWRRMAWFVPPRPPAGELALTYHPAAGLEALLRRAVSPAELVATCVQEWTSTARPNERARVEAAVGSAPKKAAPVETYNAAVRALKKR